MSDDTELPRKFAQRPKRELDKTDIFKQSFLGAISALVVVDLLKRLALWGS